MQNARSACPGFQDVLGMCAAEIACYLPNEDPVYGTCRGTRCMAHFDKHLLLLTPELIDCCSQCETEIYCFVTKHTHEERGWVIYSGHHYEDPTPSRYAWRPGTLLCSSCTDYLVKPRLRISVSCTALDSAAPNVMVGRPKETFIWRACSL